MPKTILLADDSSTIQKVVDITFANEDFSVTKVDNGEDAVARARALVPDIVLADVLMPGKNGYEVCEALKATPETAHIPVLLLAGTFEPFDEDLARRVGSDGYLSKPFETQSLIDRVKELTSRTAAAVVSATGLPPAPPPAPVPDAAPADDSFAAVDDFGAIEFDDVQVEEATVAFPKVSTSGPDPLAETSTFDGLLGEPPVPPPPPAVGEPETPLAAQAPEEDDGWASLDDMGDAGSAATLEMPAVGGFAAPVAPGPTLQFEAVQPPAAPVLESEPVAAMPPPPPYEASGPLEQVDDTLHDEFADWPEVPADSADSASADGWGSLDEIATAGAGFEDDAAPEPAAVPTHDEGEGEREEDVLEPAGPAEDEVSFAHLFEEAGLPSGGETAPAAEPTDEVTAEAPPAGLTEHAMPAVQLPVEAAAPAPTVGGVGLPIDEPGEDWPDEPAAVSAEELGAEAVTALTAEIAEPDPPAPLIDDSPEADWPAESAAVSPEELGGEAPLIDDSVGSDWPDEPAAVSADELGFDGGESAVAVTDGFDAAEPAEVPELSQPAVPLAPLAEAVAAQATPEVEAVVATADSVSDASTEQVEAVRALTREIIERVVWEVVPELAESIIREELERLVAAQTDSGGGSD